MPSFLAKIDTIYHLGKGGVGIGGIAAAQFSRNQEMIKFMIAIVRVLFG